MHKSLVLAIAVALTIAVLPPASADSVTIYADSGVGFNESSPTSYRTDYLSGGMYDTEYRSLVNFDTTSIPAGANVTSVLLHLMPYSHYDHSFGIDPEVGVFAVEGMWNETTSWSTRPTMGSQIGTDTVPCGDFLTLYWDVTSAFSRSTDFDLYVATVNPIPDTKGMLSAYGVYSSPESNRPSLDIEYTGGGEPVPEPCTIALMGLGLGGLILKRRRERA